MLTTISVFFSNVTDELAGDVHDIDDHFRMFFQ